MRPYASSPTFLSSSLFLEFFPYPLQNWSRVSYKRQSSGVYFFDKIPTAELYFEKFSSSSEVFIFFSFISTCLRLSASNNPKFLQFSFSLSVLILSRFSSSFPSVAVGLMSRVINNGPGDLVSVPNLHTKDKKKMVLDAALLNTQHYKVRIKCKVAQSK